MEQKNNVENGEMAEGEMPEMEIGVLGEMKVEEAAKTSAEDFTKVEFNVIKNVENICDHYKIPLDTRVHFLAAISDLSRSAMNMAKMGTLKSVCEKSEEAREEFGTIKMIDPKTYRPEPEKVADKASLEAGEDTPPETVQ